ncbi:MAG: PDDEXK nuclease domain-containing protein [Treponema sp.]|jgi:predicted nuclease of restriction endonuclease-like (RecB) superfamily|nr:PDDEXK nuclease domain-containing protein [Treponema sp.]
MLYAEDELYMKDLADYNSIVSQIKELLAKSRSAIAHEITSYQLKTYWEIGRIIVEHEQKGTIKAEYGKQLLRELSKKLISELGRGFSVSNLQFMRRFYLEYQIQQTLSGKLSWSHYCELLIVSDKDKRAFYERECINSAWSVRELKRQIETSLFERLLLSEGKTNKETVLALSRQGIAISKPEDILKDPYVFEFLGAREEKPMLEKDLELKLIRHIEDFLLELGRGFMFVGSQQRVTLGNTHYYAAEVNDEDDQKPIGIVLCADKHDVMAEFALGGLENTIFASRYVYYIPDKQQLIAEVKALLESESHR